jgi:hypothetical protein
VYYRIKNKIINKNNMEKKIFQSGGPIIDEDLFEDGSVAQGQEPVSGGALDGELVGGTDNFAQDPPVTDLDEPAGYVALLRVLTLQVEQFLTAYGVQGGVITYEDGSSARFSELDSAEQAEILSSLVSESVPSIEEIQSRRRRGKFTQHTAR